MSDFHGKPIKVEFIPGSGEWMGRDGKEVWLADEDGVTAVTAVDLTPFVESVEFSTKENEDA